MKVVYNVILIDAGINKIRVVKIIKDNSNFGLKQVKDMVDEAPSIVIEDLTRTKANLIKKELEAAGAKVKLEKPLWT